MSSSENTPSSQSTRPKRADEQATPSEEQVRSPAAPREGDDPSTESGLTIPVLIPVLEGDPCPPNGCGRGR